MGQPSGYVIGWTAVNGKRHAGTKALLRTDAEPIMRDQNNRWPQLRHELVPARLRDEWLSGGDLSEFWAEVRRVSGAGRL